MFIGIKNRIIDTNDIVTVSSIRKNDDKFVLDLRTLDGEILKLETNDVRKLLKIKKELLITLGMPKHLVNDEIKSEKRLYLSKKKFNILHLLKSVFSFKSLKINGIGS